MGKKHEIHIVRRRKAATAPSNVISLVDFKRDRGLIPDRIGVVGPRFLSDKAVLMLKRIIAICGEYETQIPNKLFLGELGISPIQLNMLVGELQYFRFIVPYRFAWGKARVNRFAVNPKGPLSYSTAELDRLAYLNSIGCR